MVAKVIWRLLDISAAALYEAARKRGHYWAWLDSLQAFTHRRHDWTGRGKR